MKLKLLACAVSVLLSANVLAAEPDTSGIVIGNDIGRINVPSDAQGSYGFMLGYRFNKNFALVGYARSFGDFLVDVQHRGAPTSHVGMGAVGSIPINQRISLYGIVGIGRTNLQGDTAAYAEPSVNETNASLGVRFALGQHFGLKLEHTTLIKTSVHINSVGLEYQF